MSIKETPKPIRDIRPLTGYEREQILFRDMERAARTPSWKTVWRRINRGLWRILVGREGFSPRVRQRVRPRP